MVARRPSVSGNDVLPSGGQPRAATVAACCDNAAAAFGGHACTEAVPPLADEFRGLVGALHLFDTAACGPSSFCRNRSYAGLVLAQQQLRRTFNPSVSGLIESSFAEVNRGAAGFAPAASSSRDGEGGAPPHQCRVSDRRQARLCLAVRRRMDQ